MRVVILLPWRTDNGWRERLWNHCRKIWVKNFPDWQIYAGTPDDGPFNRSQAINRAAEAAGDWDVALVIDGDTISDPDAVRRAVTHAIETGDLSIAHNQRLMLNRRGTEAVLAGRDSRTKSNVQRVWQDSVSCAVAVRRDTWDAVRGFDERFVGWGYEDTAFYVACETFTQKAAHIERADCLHLWHQSPPEATRTSPTLIRNGGLKLRYQAAHWNWEQMQAVIRGENIVSQYVGQIPKILHRTLPAAMNAQAEAWWQEFAILHPDWELRTWRDPLDPKDFPLTGHLHPHCSSGAQKAGLVRLELLVTHGGVYVDSDVQPVRPLDPLTHLPAFAAWEDENVVPDAVLGAAPDHPAFRLMLAQAVRLVETGEADAWRTGPGVSTAVLPGRDDVLLLPPGSFYPVHYKEKRSLGTRNHLPWVFAEHKWHHSWDPKKNTSSAPVKVEEVDVPSDVAICIPWRDSGDERRRRAYKWCIDWWAKCGFRPIIGLGQSRAEMCNHAARQALNNGYRVLVFADADTWCPPSQVLQAARLARENRLALAYDTYSRLDAGATQQGLRQRPGQVNAERYARIGKKTQDHVSGLVAVSAELWGRVGGFDERFYRWGFEDQAFLLACEVLGDGPMVRVPGIAVHWAHRADPTRNQTPDPVLIELMQEYCRAAGRVPGYGRTAKLAALGMITVGDAVADPDEMREVLAEEGGPLSVRTAVS